MKAETTLHDILIPARHARAIRMKRGQEVTITDVAGGQVGDVFAFAADDITEYHSASHTRTGISRLFPHVGEQFLTNKRRPILALVADTSPSGTHDMLIAACDAQRYAELGHPGHRSCAANLQAALSGAGLEMPSVPQPINVFMRIPADTAGDLSWLPADTKAGDHIIFKALMDCVLVVSACPQDLTDINNGTPTELHLSVNQGQ
ncbi:DUF1989 domain-containing protein [Arthrobacter sp. CAN_C5]|uniref:DUF1989 domain-containing protein n=1 Tax=Arthrobacter sp. CAN_C5 TaxID=2760706 RepID=UPI001AE4EC68|nr:urea carboxylase-associated family protein [Arthrobacter sp. CAN_C5]MBP2216940.1 uncharacterized protein YcgI (DUF1989 family) [Arthrobacter sp. CAN_C5]